MDYQRKYIKYKNKHKQFKSQNGGTKILPTVGSFEVVSGQLVAKDPGYELMKGSFFSDAIIPVPNGVWRAYIQEMYDDIERIKMLMILHQDYANTPESDWIKITTVDVDTGQAGFFDVKHFRDDNVVPDTANIPSYIEIKESSDKWYGMCCGVTTNEMKSGVIPFGAVSSTGYGDGSYPVYAKKLGDKIIGLKMEFK